MIDTTEIPLEGALELPNCAPTVVNPEDLGDAIAGHVVQKYYPSALLKIEEHPIPNDLFEKGLNLEVAIAMNMSHALIQANDVCDQEGIKYIAKIYTKACSIDDVFSQYICTTIRESESDFAKLVVRYSTAK